MRTKLIGVTAPIIREMGRERFSLGRVTKKMFAEAKGWPVIITPEGSPEEIISKVDLLVISGGYDLPMCFKEMTYCPGSKPEHIDRVNWERELIDIFTRYNKPILGICYGMQLINIHLGGTLGNSTGHGEGKPCSRGIGEHLTTIRKSSFLRNRTIYTSTNHRNIIDETGRGLKIIAKSQDGSIEGIEVDNIFGVQWHPEIDDTKNIIVHEFINKVI